MATISSVAGNVMRIEREDGVFNVPIADVHRHRFEMLHGIGSVFALYSLLAEDCRTFADIGKAFGLTKERIRQIYKKRIAPFLPHKNGRGRLRQCTLARVHIKQFPKITLDIWREARKQGLKVRHLNSIRLNGQVSTIKHALILNDKNCKVQKCRHRFSPNRSAKHHRSYAYIQISRYAVRRYDYFIFVMAIPGFNKRYFIIPAKDLLASVFSVKEYFTIYLPVEKHRAYNCIRPRVDWQQYENAWHLLRD